MGVRPDGTRFGAQPIERVAMPDENGHADLYSVLVGDDGGMLLWYRAVHVGTKIVVQGDEVPGKPGVMSHALCAGEMGKRRLIERLVVAVDEFETRPKPRKATQ